MRSLADEEEAALRQAEGVNMDGLARSVAAGLRWDAAGLRFAGSQLMKQPPPLRLAMVA
jgi:hypothetical protein